MSINKNLIITLLMIAFGNTLFAQQTKITDYVIFGGKPFSGQRTPLSPGYAVQLGSSTTVQGGSIGSNTLIKTTGNSTIGSSSNPTNIFSGGTIQLTNSNVVTGRLAAGNSPTGVPGTVISVGSSATIGGNIDANGNIVVGGGIVSGTVTIPSPGPPTYTYTGPVPAGYTVYGTPNLPTLPQMPEDTTFSAPGSTNINSTRKINPGTYGNVTLGGNKTLTFTGPGVYIFNSIQNSGTSNIFIFNFQNKAGTIRIYVHGNVDLGKIKASTDSSATLNGPSALPESRVYLVTKGKGTSSDPVSFKIANGSSGNASKWVGTVWAPYAAINIGSGTGSTNVTGALWSGTQVNIQSGVFMVFAPFTFCDPPQIDAGPDRPLDFSSLTTLKDNLTNATSYKWRTIGGIITSDPTQPSITVSSAGIYILTADSSGNCYARDTVRVTSRCGGVIGCELQSIYYNKTTSSPYFAISDGYVMIDIIVNSPSDYNTILSLLQNNVTLYGLIEIISNGASSYIITGKFPINNLPNLESLSALINYCRPYYQALNYIEFDGTNDGPPIVTTGLVTTAGDTSLRSYLVRKGYNVNGDGVKIGVISNSYNTITSPTTTPVKTNIAATDIVNGELPGLGNLNGLIKPVNVLKDYPGVRSDEGRAMLQIVHDVAPGAELYFRTGTITAGDFAQGIRDLHTAGCNIIVDDLTYMTEPFLTDGVVANAVKDVTTQAQKTTYFSSAGNFANKSYESDYISAPAPATFLPSGKTAHNFSAGDIFQSIELKPGNYTIVLQWLDNIHSIGQGGTINDLDIFLTPNTDGTALFGFNRDNTNRDPIEFIPFTVNSLTTTNVLIVNNTIGSNPARIKYIVFRGDIIFNEYMAGTSTLVGQANAAEAIAIGAARYDKAPPFPGPLVPEYFSSAGGTFVNGIQRDKPELVAPDGVNTTVNMGSANNAGADYDHNLYSNFFGTSAAAPHAAAVAALIIQGRKKFLTPLPPSATVVSTTPSEMRTILQNTAVDMLTPGFDFTSGYGFIDADAAMRSFAAPVSNLIQLVVPPGTVPCSGRFTLTITGENFNYNTKIYLINSPGDTTKLTPTSITSEEVIVDIDACIGNPKIQAYTPPKDGTNGTDGGFSNPKYFFESAVTIIADNKTKKYAETLTALTATVKVDGILLENTNPRLTLADLGLDNNLKFTLPAIASNPGNVGTYVITPGLINPVSEALRKKYNYEFKNGELTIEKLPIRITANNIDNAIYGETLPNVGFTYEIPDITGISNPDSLKNVIINAHQNNLARYLDAGEWHDFLGLVNDQAVVIENDQAVVIENDQAVVIENNVGYVYTFNGDGETGRLIINSSELAINNKRVTNTNAYQLTAADIANLSFLASEESVNNSRTVNSNQVIDIAQESIIWFKKNSALTYMLTSVTGADRKGLVGVNSYTNEQAVVIENDQAVVIENDQAVVIENDQAVVIENDQAVVIENGEYLVTNGNGNTVVAKSLERTAVIVDETELGINNQASVTKSLSVITGLDVDVHSIFPAALPGTPSSNNFAVTYVPGTLTIQKRTITVTANSVSRQYFDPNPELTVTYSGFAPGESFENSDIEGKPLISTTITQTTPVGVYPNSIVVTNGTLESSNYTFVFVNGTFTVETNPCLLTRAPFNNFGSTPTPQSPTSLWVNVAVKVSGQLKQDGRYLLFTGGNIKFQDINATDPVTNSLITTKSLLNGKILADKNVANAAGIYTQYDITNKTWITRIPVGFSSTSDIFISGTIINSSNGFVKKKNNANSNTVVQGIFYSDTIYSDQWTYALATYRPYFNSTAIAGTPGTGKVVAINAQYRAGTPLGADGFPINTLVNGASGGGGNNYTGSTSSWDNFTVTGTCVLTSSPVAGRGVNSPLSQAARPGVPVSEEVEDINSLREIQIIPNPATDYIILSFVSKQTGNSKIVLYSVDGSKVFEINNGTLLKDQKYVKRIDVSKLVNGMYFVQIWNGNNVTSKKIIISR